TLPVNGWTPLDLDQDGNIDVRIGTDFLPTMVMDGAAVANATQSTVAKLDSEAAIGPSSALVETFCDGFGCSYPFVYSEYFAREEWAQGGTGIMGVRFAIEGQSHFGWIRIRIADNSQPAEVIDWAYELLPGLPIYAGDSGTVACPPRLAIQPADRDVVAGASFSLRAFAVGPGVQYEWFRNGESLVSDTRFTGARTPVLTCSSADLFDTAFYTVRATSSCGSVESSQALVRVNRVCPPLEINSAVELDGTTGVVSVADDARLDLSTAATFECWVFFMDDNQLCRPISKGDGQGCETDRAFDLSFVGPAYCCSPGEWISVEYFLGSTFPTCGYASLQTAPGSVPTNQWHHLATTFDSDVGVMRLFLNGAIVGETTTDRVGQTLRGRRIYNSSRPLDLGATTTFSGTFVQGQMAEVRVWNIARAPQEIAADLGRRIDPNSPGLVAYYRLDEQFGSVAHDASPNGLNGVLSSGASFVPVPGCCAADINNDQGVDGDDVIFFFDRWDESDILADFNGDRGVDGDDIIGFFSRWDAGC
ncbi:MAG: LamG-like jellyroll fold domain-containing protein, partial [Phycisphaerales bacterium]